MFLRILFASIILVLGYAPLFANDVRFSSGKSAMSIPFEIEDNLIYVAVSINNSKSLSFILDTGAYTIVDLKRAREMGAKLKHIGQTEAIGDEQQEVYEGEKKVSFGLAGVTLLNQRVLAISMNKVEECVNKFVVDEDGREVSATSTVTADRRRKVDGILGAEFFKSVVVEIDYAARVLNIYEARSFKYSGSGTRHKLIITPQHIFVDTRVFVSDGRSFNARLLVDSGGAMAIALSKRFTDEHALLPPREQLTSSPVCGLAGIIKENSLVGNIEALQLGPLRVPKPFVEFRRANVEYESDGFLGGAILRRHKVIFDYSRGVMIMEPAASHLAN